MTRPDDAEVRWVIEDLRSMSISEIDAGDDAWAAGDQAKASHLWGRSNRLIAMMEALEWAIGDQPRRGALRQCGGINP
ncbi:MAG TPA: hypothetical protein VFP61_07510, partial [Acidimicrobiales bacterium]|nr:hypothetical protein [Acidimicrobiales bacterium]